MVSRYNELGVSGLKHFGGTIYEEFLPTLRGDKGIKIYQEMSHNSPIIRSMLFAVESLLRSVDWTVEPASESSEDIAAADFVQECMQDMSHTWEDFISEVLTMLPFGWSFFEIVYKKRNGDNRRTPGKASKFDDGKIGWRKFAPRPQDTLYRWDIDEHGQIQGFYQWPPVSDISMYRPPDSVIKIPMEKGLLFRTTSTKNNPEGVSVLRGAYRPWYFSKRIEEIEAIGVERDLAGMPMAEVPLEVLAETKTSEQQATYDYIKDVVTRVKRDEQEGLMWPLVYDENGNELYRFSLVNSPGTRQFDTSGIIQRYSQQMAMTIMADFILLGHENVGSFALSSDKTELFAVALGSWLDSIEEVLNRHAVSRLLEINGMDTTEPPKIRHGDIEKPDVTVLSTFLKDIAAAGAPVFPDLVLENRLREMADLPPIDPEEREEMLASMQEGAGGMFADQMGGFGEEEKKPAPSPDDLNAPVEKGRAKDWPDGEPFRRPQGKSMVIRPRYFDGTRWKTIYSRHNLLR